MSTRAGDRVHVDIPLMVPRDALNLDALRCSMCSKYVTLATKSLTSFEKDIVTKVTPSVVVR